MSNMKKSLQAPKFKKPKFPVKGQPQAPKPAVTGLSAGEIDLYYMSEQTIGAKELSDILVKECGQNVELWESMHVLEWITEAGHSIDIELMEAFTEEQDVAFLKEHEVAVIYAIQALDTDEALLVKCFQKVAEKAGGFLCYDSEDFQPIISLS